MYAGNEADKKICREKQREKKMDVEDFKKLLLLVTVRTPHWVASFLQPFLKKKIKKAH